MQTPSCRQTNLYAARYFHTINGSRIFTKWISFMMCEKEYSYPIRTIYLSARLLSSFGILIISYFGRFVNMFIQSFKNLRLPFERWKKSLPLHEGGFNYRITRFLPSKSIFISLSGAMSSAIIFLAMSVSTLSERYLFKGRAPKAGE